VTGGVLEIEIRVHEMWRETLNYEFCICCYIRKRCQNNPSLWLLFTLEANPEGFKEATSEVQVPESVSCGENWKKTSTCLEPQKVEELMGPPFHQEGGQRGSFSSSP
jgi:hypothetical protein